MRRQKDRWKDIDRQTERHIASTVSRGHTGEQTVPHSAPMPSNSIAVDESRHPWHIVHLPPLTLAYFLPLCPRGWFPWGLLVL